MRKIILIFLGLQCVFLKNKTFGTDVAEKHVTFNPITNEDSDNVRQLNDIYEMWDKGEWRKINEDDINYLKIIEKSGEGVKSNLAKYLLNKIPRRIKEQKRTWEKKVADVTDRLGYLLTNPPETSFGQAGIRKEQILDIPEWVLDFLDELEEKAQWLTALNQEIASTSDAEQAIGILTKLTNFFQQARKEYSRHQAEINSLLFSAIKVDEKTTNYASLFFAFALDSIPTENAHFKSALKLSILDRGIIMERFLYLMEVFCKKTIEILRR